MFEQRHQPLATLAVFIQRIIITTFFGLCLFTVSLGMGIVGYYYFAKFSWINAFLNASMVLSGMGEIDALPNNSAKLFAGFYALFCGLIFALIIAFLFTPFIHRFYHKFHTNKNSSAPST